MPSNCTDLECQLIYKWTKEKGSYNLKFSLAAKIDERIPLDLGWLGIGFSTDDLMVLFHKNLNFNKDKSFKSIKGNDNVILCKNMPNFNIVENAFTLGKFAPQLINSKNPSFGLRNSSFKTINGFSTCSFIRENKKQKSEKHLDLDNDFFILAAVGPLTPNGGTWF